MRGFPTRHEQTTPHARLSSNINEIRRAVQALVSNFLPYDVSSRCLQAAVQKPTCLLKLILMLSVSSTHGALNKCFAPPLIFNYAKHTLTSQHHVQQTPTSWSHLMVFAHPTCLSFFLMVFGSHCFHEKNHKHFTAPSATYG